MLCTFAGALLSLVSVDCMGDASDFAKQSKDLVFVPTSTSRIQSRGSHARFEARSPRTAPGRPKPSEGALSGSALVSEALSAAAILGKWCNDHNEVWIFGQKHLTHRQPDNTHVHRVRYRRDADRITVYVDGYPDEFLPLNASGTRMKLMTSGLDSSMNGWMFWRCPELLSSKDSAV